MKLPAQVQFVETYDPEKLQADLARTLEKVQSTKHDGFHQGWSTINHLEGGSRGLQRYNAARPGPALEHSPYVKEVLEGFGAPVTWARFSRMEPFGYIRPHHDPALGFHTGHLRIHLPVVTDVEKIELVIDGEECNWDEGELWFGNFFAQHHVKSHWPEPRVHIVIDVISTEAVLRMLPDDFAQQLRDDPEAVIAPDYADTLPRAGKERFCGKFRMADKRVTPVPIYGEIKLRGDDLIAEVPGHEMVYQLIPLSETELIVFGMPAVKIVCDFDGDQLKSAKIEHINSTDDQKIKLIWGMTELDVECLSTVSLADRSYTKAQEMVLRAQFKASMLHYNYRLWKDG